MALGDSVQVNASNGTGTSPSVTLGVGATAGNLLVAVLSVRCSASISDYTGLTSGYRKIQQTYGPTAGGMIAYKKAAGGETTFTCTISGGTLTNQSLTLIEIDATGMNLDILHGSAEDISQVNSTGTTVNSGTTQMVFTSGLAVAVATAYLYSNWDGSRSWSNSFVEKAFQDPDDSAKACCAIATKVLTGANYVNTTLTVTDTGNYAYGAILVFAEDAPASDPPYTVNTASYVQSFDVGDKENAPRVWFDASGTRMFVIGTGQDDLHKYTLSTAWDISTASFSQTYASFNATYYLNPAGIFWKPDGLKFYISTGFSDRIQRYSVSSAWDLASTVTEESGQYQTLTTQTASPQAIAFSSDGTKCFVLGSDNDTVFSYSMSTPWSVATGSWSYDSVSFSVANQTNTPAYMCMAGDGTQMYIMCAETERVYRYVLSSAWDLSTAAFTGDSLDVYAQTTDGPLSVFVPNDGLHLYVTSDSLSPDKVFQYSLPSGLAFTAGPTITKKTDTKAFFSATVST